MIDREKISRDIGTLKARHGSYRAVSRITDINKTSLEQYAEQTTEPREKNVLRLAKAMRRNPDYYYSGQSDRTDNEPSAAFAPEEYTALMKKHISALERIIDLEAQLKEARGKQLLTGNAPETASDG